MQLKQSWVAVVLCAVMGCEGKSESNAEGGTEICGDSKWYGAESPQITEVDVAREDGITIAFVGDVMLGRSFNDHFAADPVFNPWRALELSFADVDVFAMNLETTITDWDEPWPEKAYNFRLSPQYRDRALRSLPTPAQSLHYASLANNHILDFERQGLLDTLDNLDALDFVHAGAGRTSDEAQAPTIVETTSGFRIGFLAGADHCGCNDVCAWNAQPAQSGMWYVNTADAVRSAALDAVRRVRDSVDVLVFSLHWGPNWVDGGPPDWMQNFARALVEAGVDVIHGHSSHHVLPVETIAGKHVFYGLGDFINDYRVYPDFNSNLGFIAKLHIDPSGEQSLEVLPTRIGHDGTDFVEALDTSDRDYELVREMAGFGSE